MTSPRFALTQLPLRCDYEELLHTKEVLEEPLKDLVTYPDDDVLVHLKPRKFRTVKPPVTAEELTDNPHLQECFRFFNNDWVSLEHKYTKDGYLDIPTPTSEHLPPHEFEVDLASDSVVQAVESTRDDVDPALLAQYFHLTEEELAAERDTNRFRLFRMFQCQGAPNVRDERPAGETFDRPDSTQFIVVPRKLAFDCGAFEPLFGTLALYDLDTKSKISEDFKFDLNEDRFTAFMGPQYLDRDPIAAARAAMFSVKTPSTGIYMVLRVEKVLQGPEDEALESYMRGDSKYLTKAETLATEYCARLSAYRQSVGVGFFQVFEKKDDERKPHVVPGTCEMTKLFKPRDLSDDAILELLFEFKEFNKSKRSKIIPGCFRFQLESPDSIDEFKNALDTSLNPLRIGDDDDSFNDAGSQIDNGSDAGSVIQGSCKDDGGSDTEAELKFLSEPLATTDSHPELRSHQSTATVMRVLEKQEESPVPRNRTPPPVPPHSHPALSGSSEGKDTLSVADIQRVRSISDTRNSLPKPKVAPPPPPPHRKPAQASADSAGVSSEKSDRPRSQSVTDNLASILAIPVSVPVVPATPPPPPQEISVTPPTETATSVSASSPSSVAKQTASSESSIVDSFLKGSFSGSGSDAHSTVVIDDDDMDMPSERSMTYTHTSSPSHSRRSSGTTRTYDSSVSRTSTVRSSVSSLGKSTVNARPGTMQSFAFKRVEKRAPAYMTALSQGGRVTKAMGSKLLEHLNSAGGDDILDSVDDVDDGPLPDTIKEIEDFQPTGTPFVDYVNNLYVYPLKADLSGRSGGESARNIVAKIMLKDDDSSVNSPPLASIYGNSVDKAFTTHANTSVVYHERNPAFFNEIKVKLPAVLTPKHHLLIVFSHVHCQKQKKMSEVANTVGYAVVRLMDNGQFVRPDQGVPISMNCPDNYLSPAGVSQMQYIDKGEPTFKLRLRLLSSFYSQNQAIGAFSASYFAHDHTLAEKIKKLQDIDREEFQARFPIILNQLLEVLSTSQDAVIRAEAFETFIRLIRRVEEEAPQTTGRHTQLTSYVNYAFNNATDRTVFSPYEELCYQWLFLMKQKMLGSDSQRLVRHLLESAWVLFDIIIKSMTLELDQKGLLRDQSTRAARFSPKVTIVLKQLVESLVHQLTVKKKQAPTPTKDGGTIKNKDLSMRQLKKLNTSLAWFLRDLFSIMDRGVVFELIHTYDAAFSKMIDEPFSELAAVRRGDADLLEMQNGFLNTVTAHPHYVILNLPVRFQYMPASDVKASIQKLMDRHFMASLSVNEIARCLMDTQKKRTLSLGVLRDLLRHHDFDSRYADNERRERIASMYFPLVLLLMDKEMQSCIRALAISERRQLLISLLYIVKDLPKPMLDNWWAAESSERLILVIDLLQEASEAFAYGDTSKKVMTAEKFSAFKSKMEGIYEQRAEGTNTMRGRVRPYVPRVIGGSMRGPPTRMGLHLGDHDEEHDDQPPKEIKEEVYDARLDANLSHEANMIVLDCIVRIIKTNKNCLTMRSQSGVLTGSVPMSPISPTGKVFMSDSPFNSIKQGASTASSQPTELFKHIFNILVWMLCQKQSHYIVSALFHTLGTFIREHRSIIFDAGNTFVADLIEQVMRMCSFRADSIRKPAAAFLFFLIKSNHEEIKHFALMKIRATHALSKIITDSFKEVECLSRSFANVAGYAQLEAQELPEFAKDVEALCQLWNSILRDTKELSQLGNAKVENHIQQDLYARIAKGYKHAPELRLSWLEKLAQFNENHDFYAEAAYARLHVVTMLYEIIDLSYQRDFERERDVQPSHNASVTRKLTSPDIVTARKILTLISPSLCDDMNLQRTPDMEHVFQANVFTTKSLIAQMQKVILLLKQALMMETANMVYKLLVPIYEDMREFKELERCHKDMRAIMSDIARYELSGARPLGTYYRVKYLGAPFGELSGSAFLYKEEKLTRLQEITERMKRVYVPMYGEKFHVIQSNAKLVESELQADHAYVQVSSLLPFFEPREAADRKTYFERNTSLRRFYFETPFTESGAPPHSAEVNDQCKRKTILEVAVPFPYFKNRQPLDLPETEVNMSPIEAGTEIIVQRVDQIRAEIDSILALVKVRTVASNRIVELNDQIKKYRSDLVALDDNESEEGRELHFQISKKEHERNRLTEQLKNKINLNQLQILLQGSVRLQVNAGPSAICKAFLGEPDRYPADKIAACRLAFKRFLFICDKGLELNDKYVEDNQRPFHKELLVGYEEAKAYLGKYVSGRVVVKSVHSIEPVNPSTPSGPMNIPTLRLGQLHSVAMDMTGFDDLDNFNDEEEADNEVVHLPDL